MRIDRPANTEPCATERCGHPFGMHFLTHDQQASGCALGMPATPAGDPSIPCPCAGFTIRYAYKPRTRAKAVQP